MKKKKINVLAARNGVGLQKDQEILAEILRGAGHDIEENNVRQKSLFFHKQSQSHYDLNIFCQEINPFWFKAAKQNWLIPNQELFSHEEKKFLKDISLVVCKTHYAKRLFDQLGCQTAYTSFTSMDRWKPEVEKQDFPFFHLAGKSPYKGTEAVIEAWKENPDFPELIILEDPGKHRSDPGLKNLRYISEHSSDEYLIQLQNQCGCHLCPSLAEGFGHYIMEALSCKALVLTTDAPPMNELVRPDRGMLCPYQAETVSGIGSNFFIKAKHLAEKVREMMDIGSDVKLDLAEKGRQFYLENDRLFRNRLIQVIEEYAR
jgi:glycosyltransferase involved in cell wall biosynthesis